MLKIITYFIWLFYLEDFVINTIANTKILKTKQKGGVLKSLEQLILSLAPIYIEF